MCGRYRMVGEPCWSCFPREPDHCHCDDLPCCHMHYSHALFDRLWQMDLESVDERILQATDRWEEGVARERRDDPEYKAWLARNPELRSRARRGIDAVFAFFALSPREADAWALEAAGYTVAAIAHSMQLKPGGVSALLEAVHSKIGTTMHRLEQFSVKAG